MTVKEFMNKKVLTVSKEDSILDAARAMASHDVGALIIVNKAKNPLGIVTERDILKKIVAYERDANNVKVKDVMTTDMVTVEADSSILSLSQQMEKNNLRRMPVTKKGKLVGIITSRDLIKIMSGI